MAKTTIEEICENAKLARDMALTGNYDSACIYYEGLQVEHLCKYSIWSISLIYIISFTGHAGAPS